MILLISDYGASSHRDIAVLPVAPVHLCNCAIVQLCICSQTKGRAHLRDASSKVEAEVGHGGWWGGQFQFVGDAREGGPCFRLQDSV